MRICLYTFVAKKISIFYYRRKLIVSQQVIGRKDYFSTKSTKQKALPEQGIKLHRALSAGFAGSSPKGGAKRRGAIGKVLRVTIRTAYLASPFGRGGTAGGGDGEGSPACTSVQPSQPASPAAPPKGEPRNGVQGVKRRA